MHDFAKLDIFFPKYTNIVLWQLCHQSMVSTFDTKGAGLVASRLGKQYQGMDTPKCFNCKICMLHMLFLLTATGQH